MTRRWRKVKSSRDECGYIRATYVNISKSRRQTNNDQTKHPSSRKWYTYTCIQKRSVTTRRITLLQTKLARIGLHAIFTSQRSVRAEFGDNLIYRFTPLPSSWSEGIDYGKGAFWWQNRPNTAVRLEANAWTIIIKIPTINDNIDP